MAEAPPEPAAAAPAAARPDPRVPRGAPVPRSGPAGLAGDIVLVIDTSASMGATDVTPTRLDAAKAGAIDALKRPPRGRQGQRHRGGRTARVVANGTTRPRQRRRRSTAIPPSYDVGDLGDALRLASALAARSGDAEILVATDARRRDPAQGAPSTRRSGSSRWAATRATRRSSRWRSGPRRRPSRTPRSCGWPTSASSRPSGGSSSTPTASCASARPHPRPAAQVGRRHRRRRRPDLGVYRGPARRPRTRPTAAPDPLAIDDRAWAIVPPTEPQRPAGRRRAILPRDRARPTCRTRPVRRQARRYAQDAARTDGTDWDLIIFEGFVPAALPSTPILAIAPPTTSPLGDGDGDADEPGHRVARPGPTRSCATSTCPRSHVGRRRSSTLPGVGPRGHPGPAGRPAPLLRDLAGLPAAVLAFEPRRSDLPLQVAFPMLLANLAGELLGGSQTPADAIAPGSPVDAPDPRRREGRPRRAAGRERATSCSRRRPTPAA